MNELNELEEPNALEELSAFTELRIWCADLEQFERKRVCLANGKLV